MSAVLSNDVIVSRSLGESRRQRRTVRWLYAPFMLLGVNGVGVWLATSGGSRLWLLVGVGLFASATSMVAERLIPYEPEWNIPRDDGRRDTAHAVVNETIEVGAVIVLPVLVSAIGSQELWPGSWPFVVQVVLAVLVADAGITFVHMASHKLGVLWRLHAVHHSIKRFYGFNGLMKHPLHASIEMAAGTLPLMILGLPMRVAGMVALAVVVQLLMQHSNADYTVGHLQTWLALNEGHRFHHLKWPQAGDVNFGLFTLAWDHLVGTFSFDPDHRFSSDQLGIAVWPRYPTRWLDQMLAPFRPTDILLEPADERAP
ncbi:MAG: sterol desaturase family protein [Acidimicrobiales bacterium]|nr:sterol desaturase family protein [Acidimicrobiales bacterium]